MLEKLLVNSDLQKYRIFKHLQRKVTINDLMELMNLSRTPLKLRMEELKSDLYEIGEIQIIKVENRFLTLSSDKESIRKYEQELKKKYYQNSILFNIFEYLLVHKKVGITPLSEIFSLSESYMYVEIKKINDILERHNLRLDIRKKTVILNGCPILSKCLLMFIYNNVFNNQTWPEWLMDQKIADLTLDPRIKRKLPQVTTRMHDELLLLHAIQYSFSNSQRLVRYLPTDVQLIMEAMMKVNNLANENLPYVSMIKEDSVKRNELLATNFIMRIFFPSIDSEKKIVEIGKKISQIRKTQLFHFGDSLISEIESKRKITYSIEEKYALYYYLALFYIQKKLFGVILIHKIENYDDHIKKERAESFDALYKLLKTLSTKSAFFTHYEDCIYVIAKLFFIFEKRSAPVKIFSQFYNHPVLSDRFLKKGLNAIFSKNLLTFTSDIHNSDIVITDNYFEERVLSKYIIVSDIYNLEEWEEVIVSIQKFIN